VEIADPDGRDAEKARKAGCEGADRLHVTPYADRLASEGESAHGEANDRADNGCQESA
jgi:hypothetical protein